MARRLVVRLSGAQRGQQVAGTPALREAIAPPSAGLVLLDHRAIGAAHTTQQVLALRDA